MINLLLQSSSSTEAFTRLQQTIGLIVVNLGTVTAVFVFVLKTLNDLKKTAKDTKNTAKELLATKDEIVIASDRNYEAIKVNTMVTQNQAVEIQKHLVDRVRKELIPLSQRVGRLESHLFTDEETGTAPTKAWSKDNEDFNQSP
jgi:hypothetical protein